MRTLTVLLAMLAGLTFGQVTPEQVDSMPFYHASYEVTLNDAGTVFFLQLAKLSGKRVYAQAAVLECSADCLITQDRNGTPATGTAVAAVGLNTSGTPAATFYRASNAGAGAALSPITVKAGNQQPVDMTFTAFARGADDAQNHNWRVAPMTGTVRVTVVWGEI